MTVGELIDRLKEMDPNLLVLKYQPNSESWVSMDGWWPQVVTVEHLSEGRYVEARFRASIEALEI
jgi:hypothetical protein